MQTKERKNARKNACRQNEGHGKVSIHNGQEIETASKFILYEYGYCDTEVNTQVSRDVDSNFRFY